VKITGVWLETSCGFAKKKKKPGNTTSNGTTKKLTNFKYLAKSISSTSKMAASGFSETSVTLYHTVRRHIQADGI